LGLSGTTEQEIDGNVIMRGFVTGHHHNILSGSSNQKERDGWGMWHEWGTGEVRIGFLVWKPKGKRQLGRPRHIWEDNIKTAFN
jgi:hypothetical protein